MNTIRAKIDTELTRRIGTWFTVREIQDKLKVNPATLKPLIMKYAREKVLRRRQVKGTARSVEFSPAAASINSFEQLLTKSMPYRLETPVVTQRTTSRKTITSSKLAACTKKGCGCTSKKKATAKKPAAKKPAKKK